MGAPVGDEATEPGYDGHVSAPVLWDRQRGRIVSNNFPDITIDLATQFGEWANPAVELYPGPLRPEIDALNDRVYAAVNDGVYRCGFAPTQAAYDGAAGERPPPGGLPEIIPAGPLLDWQAPHDRERLTG